jgi:hypothetical protein
MSYEPDILRRPHPARVTCTTLRNPTPAEAARGIVFAHENANFSAYRGLIERMELDERFRVETYPTDRPAVAYEMSRREFERTFKNWLTTRSWLDGGFYTIGAMASTTFRTGMLAQHAVPAMPGGLA